MNYFGIDMQKPPYRGTYATVGRQLGVSREAIRQAVDIYRNPRIIELVAAEIEKRKQRQEAAERRLRNAING